MINKNTGTNYFTNNGNVNCFEETQKEVLEKSFVDWKKDEEQIDDVTILGVSI